MEINPSDFKTVMQYVTRLHIKSAKDDIGEADGTMVLKKDSMFHLGQVSEFASIPISVVES